MQAEGFKEQMIATWIDMINDPDENYWFWKCGGPLSGDVYYSTKNNPNHMMRI